MIPVSPPAVEPVPAPWGWKAPSGILRGWKNRSLAYRRAQFKTAMALDLPIRESSNNLEYLKLTKRILILTMIIVIAGCQRLGKELARAPLPPGAPDVSSILADLAANDAAVQSFRGPCSVTLESPDLAGKQVLHKSSVYFRRPESLHVVGRKYGSTVMRLTSAGSEFLIEFPAEKEYYYRLEGEHIESVSFSVSPSDIAREMFFPEPWASLDVERMRLAGYDEQEQIARLELLEPDGKHVQRLLTVQGPPWVIIRSERLDQRGRVISVTTLQDYRRFEDVNFPTTVEAVFPLEETAMTLTFRDLKPNAPIEDDFFDIDARARELGIVLDRTSDAPQQGKY